MPGLSSGLDCLGQGCFRWPANPFPVEANDDEVDPQQVDGEGEEDDPTHAEGIPGAEGVPVDGVQPDRKRHKKHKRVMEPFQPLVETMFATIRHSKSLDAAVKIMMGFNQRAGYEERFLKASYTSPKAAGDLPEWNAWRQQLAVERQQVVSRSCPRISRLAMWHSASVAAVAAVLTKFPHNSAAKVGDVRTPPVFFPCSIPPAFFHARGSRHYPTWWQPAPNHRERGAYLLCGSCGGLGVDWHVAARVRHGQDSSYARVRPD